MKAKISVASEIRGSRLIWKRLEIDLPEGFYRVFDGAVKPDDYFLDCVSARRGETIWLPAGTNDPPYDTADLYACLIRSGIPVSKPCERCEFRKAVFGERFCEDCREKIKREIRKND